MWFWKRPVDRVAALINQTIKGQSFLYRLFTSKGKCDPSEIRRLELTYLAASITTVVYLRVAKEAQKEITLDAFTLAILDESIPYCDEQISLHTAIANYQQRFAEYSRLLKEVFNIDGRISFYSVETLLAYGFYCAVGRPGGGLFIEIASKEMAQYVRDQIDFVTAKLSAP